MNCYTVTTTDGHSLIDGDAQMDISADGMISFTQWTSGRGRCVFAAFAPGHWKSVTFASIGSVQPMDAQHRVTEETTTEAGN